MKKILAFLISASLLFACSLTPATQVPTTAPQLQISDPAKNLEATAGNEFKIIIDSNPTTGYHWEIIGELDEAVLEFISQEYRADEPMLTGSGGVDVFTFKALKAGETLITLGYYPPSNDPVEPDQIVTFNVTVK
jgi:inhibitor of cysteine peptidase